MKQPPKVWLPAPKSRQLDWMKGIYSSKTPLGKHSNWCRHHPKETIDSSYSKQLSHLRLRKYQSQRVKAHPRQQPQQLHSPSYRNPTAVPSGSRSLDYPGRCGDEKKFYRRVSRQCICYLSCSYPMSACFSWSATSTAMMMETIIWEIYSMSISGYNFLSVRSVSTPSLEIISLLAITSFISFSISWTCAL